MSFLLDTQIAVLAVTMPESLSEYERNVISQSQEPVCVSLVSAWEIAIKNGLGPRRDAFPFTTERALSLFRSSGFVLLAISEHHLLTLETLPRLHGDPFDRLLVAQAISDELVLISRDRKITAYVSA